ncbi:competence type IV pilus minor pilin ComGF [Enterococcus pseudoavium]|uniref:competence type IV pilus minor pilin ComGF n=1 Tax=Enterococcus pseudoavium TaxID=44007 RepID=UPI00082DF824|nr:competence type IV pilus minor pilin ComGF [Enterococcus pseudoavium]
MKENSGFTLLESMVALIMLSGVLLLLAGLIQHANKIEQSLKGYHQLEWEIYLLQLDNELAELPYIETSGNEIICKTDAEESVFIQQFKDKIIKRQSGGYQPLLTGVKKFVCQEENQGVDFSVTFTDGKQKKGTWIFE